jgi:hypothetical protein
MFLRNGLPPTFTLVSCSAYFSDPEDGGDMFLRNSVPPAFKLVSCSAYFLDPEDGGDTFLRNVGWHSTDYTALYPRRQYSS